MLESFEQTQNRPRGKWQLKTSTIPDEHAAVEFMGITPTKKPCCSITPATSGSAKQTERPSGLNVRSSPIHRHRDDGPAPTYDRPLLRQRFRHPKTISAPSYASFFGCCTIPGPRSKQGDLDKPLQTIDEERNQRAFAFAQTAASSYSGPAAPSRTKTLRPQHRRTSGSRIRREKRRRLLQAKKFQPRGPTSPFNHEIKPQNRSLVTQTATFLAELSPPQSGRLRQKHQDATATWSGTGKRHKEVKLGVQDYLNQIPAPTPCGLRPTSPIGYGTLLPSQAPKRSVRFHFISIARRA